MARKRGWGIGGKHGTDWQARVGKRDSENDRCLRRRAGKREKEIMVNEPGDVAQGKEQENGGVSWMRHRLGKGFLGKQA